MNKKAVIIRRIILLVLVLWAGVIFYFSSEVPIYSNEKSLSVADFISGLFSLPPNFKLDMHWIVRKLAHFGEFAIFGGLATLYCFFLTFNQKKATLYGFIIAVIYAMSDEIHQYFVKGRSCRILDVGIDSLGAICAILILNLIIMLIKKYLVNKKSKPKARR